MKGCDHVADLISTRRVSNSRSAWEMKVGRDEYWQRNLFSNGPAEERTKRIIGKPSVHMECWVWGSGIILTGVRMREIAIALDNTTASRTTYFLYHKLVKSGMDFVWTASSIERFLPVTIWHQVNLESFLGSTL